MSTSLFSYVAVLQAIMKMLGLYDGAVDGLWGPKCVDAIKEWARDESFDPAMPTLGAIFVAPCRLPKGLTWVKRQGVYFIDYSLLPSADKAKVDALLAEYKPVTNSAIHEQHDIDGDAPVQQAAAKVPTKPVQPVTTQSQQPATPVKESTVEGTADKAATEAK